MFGFVLAITEVNTFLVVRYFTFANGTLDGCPTLLKFRRILAWQLTNNRWIVDEERAEAEARIGMVHRILTAPKHAKKYQRRRWECTAAAPYQQYKCRGGCNKKVRTYCACSPGVWLCFNCFPQHIRSAESEDGLTSPESILFLPLFLTLIVTLTLS